MDNVMELILARNQSIQKCVMYSNGSLLNNLNVNAEVSKTITSLHLYTKQKDKVYEYAWIFKLETPQCSPTRFNLPSVKI